LDPDKQRGHPKASVPIVESHKTKTIVKIPTVFKIKFLDEASKPLRGLDVEIKEPPSSTSRVKTDSDGIVKVRKTTKGVLALRVVPPDQGNPSDWSSKPSNDDVDSPKALPS